MRKSLLLFGSLVTLGGVGTVLAQTTVDGLDLEAINKAAQAHTRNLGQFVDQVLGHQAEASADLAEDLEALVERSQAKVKAEAAARAKATPRGDPVNLDALVADAGQSMAPSPHSAPMLIAFASLSMPPESLKRMIADVSKASGMVVFRGFSPSGPKPFMAALHEAVGETTAAHVSIDPRLFRAYGIAAVPTYVVASSSFDLCSGEDCASSPTPYDRIAGNVTTHFALETIAQGRGPGAPAAKTALANLERAP
ncbi:type-F conjugative transfer system pilin assembly protein TrbC [Novosphingobium sp. Fuku2-ISO-50]|uniref:type-F conjugative transfer system pilin assembly protein TrbC n=1 Tax=Novosphingobium sp. Fuku2-ISO-50 TaxID=1739114 RepID=UPI00076C6EBA|nr:type-F conjugative transfer system pilin assembly protein TrbC [Novosphingobium sp. Fuku2-ISO-50]KUR74227.1 pilus assembly protein [Novosphingobium sp. Fuku2-ISO-50]